MSEDMDTWIWRKREWRGRPEQRRRSRIKENKSKLDDSDMVICVRSGKLLADRGERGIQLSTNRETKERGSKRNRPS
ncbi:hypothetical protein J4Q44_G00058940 [Coregonus suidteri]|uniref:Uncharacterized protein n=1 Tax=Coregonus suidteri TaxID=861788 RepID=A0AAN8R0F9_9TELE